MTDHAPHCGHRVREHDADSAAGDSTSTDFGKHRDRGNTPSTDPVLRILSFDGSPQSTTVLLLAVEREIPAFDLVFHLQAPRERHGISAELARALHIAVSEGVPILRVTGGQQPAEAVTLKIQEILGYSSGAEVSDGAVVEVGIAASLDDLHLATGSDVPFIRNCFPLLDMGWGHRECQAYLRSLRREHSTKAQRLRRGWSL